VRDAISSGGASEAFINVVTLGVGRPRC
jgi:hypothetical protein